MVGGLLAGAVIVGDGLGLGGPVSGGLADLRGTLYTTDEGLLQTSMEGKGWRE